MVVCGNESWFPSAVPTETAGQGHESAAARIGALARILVVDDDGRHAQSVRELLELHGYEVVSETEPRRGLDIVRRGTFDVLLLDLNMPGLSGVEFLDALGEAPFFLKTIVLSGATRVADVAPILRRGVYDYLAKPYSPAELVTRVRNAADQVVLERNNARMQQEKAIANRRDQFLVSASPDLIYTLDAAGRFSFANGKLSDVLGYDSSSLLGRHWTELVAAPMCARLHHRIDERRSGARATRHLEIDYLDHGGVPKVLELSAMGIYDGVEPNADRFRGTYGIIRDVTEPRRTARELAQSQQKFYGLFVNVPDAVFISALDDGRVIECNDGFRRLAASIGADGANDAALWADSSQRAAFVAELESSPARHQTTFERQLASGLRYFEATGRLIPLDGVRCMIASIRDRTVEKQAELDRLSFESQLQQASKMEAIGQLAGGIAHDFNNILASIIGYTELALVTHTSGVDTQGYLKEVIVAGQRARDLISQMLTFTGAHRGNARITSLGESIVAVSRILRAAIPRAIDVDVSLDAAAAPVMIDPVQLQQVVINLLVNARDAIDGSGRIDVRVNRVSSAGRCASCEASFEGDYVALSVADTGHGIAPGLLPRIFDRFMTTREPGRGTGIGLWLIHTIVHEYDGHIGVVSGPAGTTFNIYLPPASLEALVDQRAEGAMAAPPGLRGCVLVVDDEVSMSNFIAEVLRDAGYATRVFNDGAAALDYMDGNAEQIALILADHAMAHVSGLDIAVAAKRKRAELPVVVLTGYSDRADQERLERAGVARLLAKPFRIDALLLLARELTAVAPTALTEAAFQ